MLTTSGPLSDAAARVDTHAGDQGVNQGMTGWSRVQWLKFSVLAVVLFVVAPIVAPFVGGSAAAAVVWASGIVLLIYTIETHEVRREMLRNNTMQVQPVLLTKLADPPPGGGTGLVLWVWNVGKGAALHIEFEDIDIEGT